MSQSASVLFSSSSKDFQANRRTELSLVSIKKRFEGDLDF
jgi:hypothetical protein